MRFGLLLDVLVVVESANMVIYCRCFPEDGKEQK